MLHQVRYEVNAGVAWITMDRPEAMNAMNHELLADLAEAVQLGRADKSVRALLLTGAGKAFCAGGDVKWMAATRGASSRDEDWRAAFDSLVQDLNRVILLIRDTEKPVLAAVNGFASGAGFSLALACDLRLVSEQAKFNQAYVSLGLTPDGGSTYFLTLMLGPARALDLIFSGRVLDAREALALGLASELFPAGSFAAGVKQYAEKIAAGPTLAFRQAKMLVNEAHRRSLAAQLDLERESIVGASLSNDFAAGLQAFAARSKPVFKGN